MFDDGLPLWSWLATGCQARACTSPRARASINTDPLPLPGSAHHLLRAFRLAKTARAGRHYNHLPQLTPTLGLRASIPRREPLVGAYQSLLLPTHIMREVARTVHQSE